MPLIKHIDDGEVLTVSNDPVWICGIWECGDQRFTDVHCNQYAPVEELPLLTPMTLYMAFTPAERIAIKSSEDPLVKEFWDMYQLSVNLQKPTDPNLVSVREAIAYLAAPKQPGPGTGILASVDRVQQILRGDPQ
jgi:hypothetical protein